MAQQVSLPTLVPNNFEPKRVFRWLMVIDGIDCFLMKAARRPIITPRRWPFHPKISDINAEIYDSIAPSGSKQVMDWVRDNRRRNVELKLLDPLGIVVEHWAFGGVRLKKADFGKLDYAADGACTITLDMRCSTFEHRF